MSVGPLGVHLGLLIGPTVPVPAPRDITTALKSVEVRQADEGRSGFQLQFESGRDMPLGLMEHPLLRNPLLEPFNRVVILVTLGVVPTVLMDGFITNSQLLPSNAAGGSTLTLTGQDVTVMMEMEEKDTEWVGMPDALIAFSLLVPYAQYGVIPTVIPPAASEPVNPVERTPTQQGTDREFLAQLADYHGFIFFVKPGPMPLASTAYWGPRFPISVPQPALRVGMGPHSNVTSLNFGYDALKTELVEGVTQDPTVGVDFPIMSGPTIRPPLAMESGLVHNRGHVRRRQYRDSGDSTPGALIHAQAITDASSEVVEATGEVDGLIYGAALQPRALVGVAGAGDSYDGMYYVKQVSHTIRRGQYKQSFTLTREGVGTTTPVVVP
jgi:hypothetical protein